jgi:uncharacterized ferritin-like protein (DUF455 family)
MQMREAAEKILLGRSLDEKLELAPEHASDDEPGKAILVPDSPGRPDELIMSAKGVKVSFPGINRLDEDRERGKMMHFLANHELLAAELMALVLLKFPDAPKEYRAGVYEAMREEQMHTLMYMRRMRDCGIDFGDLPVNDYFWKLVAPMETPMDFVTRLNLTFEQSNLDFSKHYAGLFRQVGDVGTAAVLEKIYLDEIGHVGHGVKWFRKWKKQGQTDWQAFKTSLTFPLAPAKAKGIAPFNAEGRRLAGFDDDFISHLEVCEQSRGRTPVLHWFNPNAESHVRAHCRREKFTPNKMQVALEHDLEMVMLAWCRRDDMVLMRKPPSREHLARLKGAGFELPEIVALDCPEDIPVGRKLGGLRPWAWSPECSEQLHVYASDVQSGVPWQWRQSVPALWFSKEIGVRLNGMLGLSDGVGCFCADETSAWSAVQQVNKDGDVLLKAPYDCAGRGHQRVKPDSSEQEIRRWITKMLTSHGGVVVEPWLDRVLDFSSLYEMTAPGEVKFIGMTEMENDAAGRFIGTHVYPKWGTGIPPEVAEFLFRKADVMTWYKVKIPSVLSELLEGYIGPVGVDAMVHRNADGSLALRHIIELNVRMTMGRVALELQKKSGSGKAGRLQILRKKQSTAEVLDQLVSSRDVTDGILLNDPQRAHEFLAHWQVAGPCGQLIS